MDPLLMFGAWAAALLSIVGAMRVIYNGVVKGVRSVVHDELRVIWTDMQAAEDRFGEVEKRLDGLEAAMREMREQLNRLTELLVAHVSEMTRRHPS